MLATVSVSQSVYWVFFFFFLVSQFIVRTCFKSAQPSSVLTDIIGKFRVVRSLRKKPSKPDWMFQRISYYLNDKHIAILRSAIPDTHTHSHIHTHAFISLVLLFFLYSIYPICNNLICFLVYDVFSLPYSKTNKSRDLI